MKEKKSDGNTGKQADYIGKDKLTLRVLIVAERVIFGRSEYQIEPMSGGGRKWVSAAKLSNLN